MKPMPAFGPRARWKAVAITSPDPVEFAREYEETMNGLVSDGWQITGMMNRGEAVIITAQKPDLPPALMEALAALSGKKPLPPRTADTKEEVVYTFKEGDQIHSLPCTLEEAVKYLEEHIEEDGDILPISIVVMTVTSYEPADLKMLRALMK